jgi:DNA-binding CsgD family transcriptional regulator
MVDKRPETCWDAIDEAVKARLIEPSELSGTYRFAHALVRDAVEAALPSAERVRLHRRAVAAIEGEYGANLEQQLFQLAHHWAVAAAGGDKRTAAEWIGRAAAEASRRSAYEESADLFRLALSIGGGSLTAHERCLLLLGEGAAAHGAADLRARLEACAQAAEIGRSLGRADLIAEAALILEGTLEPAQSNLTARRLCEEALAALDVDELALRARVTARLAQLCAYLGDGKSALAISEEALQLAERSGDATAVDDALHGRQMARDGPDGLSEREALAARLSQLARDTHVASRELWARLWLVDGHFERGDLAAAARQLELLRSLADDVGGPWPQWHVLRGLSVLAQARAHFDQARRLARDALQVIARTGDPLAGIPYAAILQTAGHHTGQDQESLAASGFGGGPVDVRPFLTAGTTPMVAAALLLLEAGRTAEAEELYRSLGPPDRWRPHAHGTLAALSMGLRAAVGLGAKDDDLADLCAMLEPYRSLHAASGAGAVAYWGPVELALGIGQRRLEHFDRAVTDLHQAVRACAVSGADGFRVEAEVELAEVLAMLGNARDRDRSATLAADALHQATSLGMGPFVSRARAVLRGLDGTHGVGALTRREREVAELMAQGLTNAQIAARLFLSPRTAQTHVQHVLSKLEMDNRAQVAAWVTAQKLRTASR